MKPKTKALIRCVLHMQKTKTCADQLHGYLTADQHFCFRYIDSTITLLPKSEFQSSSLATFYGCTAWFVSDRVNPEDRFSHEAAHVSLMYKGYCDRYFNTTT